MQTDIVSIDYLAKKANKQKTNKKQNNDNNKKTNKECNTYILKSMNYSKRQKSSIFMTYHICVVVLFFFLLLTNRKQALSRD